MNFIFITIKKYTKLQKTAKNIKSLMNPLVSWIFTFPLK